MPKNNKKMTSVYSKWNGEFPCGIIKEFDSTGQRNIWVKLHKTKCDLCCEGELVPKQTTFHLTN